MAKLRKKSQASPSNVRRRCGGRPLLLVFGCVVLVVLGFLVLSILQTQGIVWETWGPPDFMDKWANSAGSSSGAHLIDADGVFLKAGAAADPVIGCGGSGRAPPDGPCLGCWNGVGKRPCGGRIYFLFMLIDKLFHTQVWKDFFKTAPPGSFRVLVHCANSTLCEDSGILSEFPMMQLVETVDSIRCTDLVSPLQQLVKGALNMSEDLAGFDVVQKFLVVSHTTLPTKPFDVIYKALTAHGESDFCFVRPKKWLSTNLRWLWKDGKKSKVVSGGKNQSLLAKHSQFVVLNLAHAQIFAREWTGVDLSKEGSWDIPLKSPRWNVSGSITDLKIPVYRFSWFGSCPDEFAVFSSIFGTLENEGFGGVCPLNSSVRSCDAPAQLMEQRRCGTLSIGSKSHFFVKLVMNDPGSLLQVGVGSSWGHANSFLRLSNASLLRLRFSSFMFARKFDNDTMLPHYSDVIFRPHLRNEESPAEQARLIESARAADKNHSVVKEAEWVMEPGCELVDDGGKKPRKRGKDCVSVCEGQGLNCSRVMMHFLRRQNFTPLAFARTPTKCTSFPNIQDVNGRWDGPNTDAHGQCLWTSSQRWEPSCYGRPMCGFTRLCPCMDIPG